MEDLEVVCVRVVLTCKPSPWQLLHVLQRDGCLVKKGEGNNELNPQGLTDVEELHRWATCGRCLYMRLYVCLCTRMCAYVWCVRAV